MKEQDWAKLNYYKNDNLELSSLNKDKIVFIGDSITEQWQKVVPSFFSENPYINRGISGQTTSQILVRFRQDVINLKPSAVILLAGINDIASNMEGSTIEMIMDNIMSMVEIAKANNVKILLASVLPVCNYNYEWATGFNPADKIVKLNDMIKNYTIENNIIYVDYYSALVDEQNSMKEEYTTDGIHLNEIGYRKIINVVEDAIEEM